MDMNTLGRGVDRDSFNGAGRRSRKACAPDARPCRLFPATKIERAEGPSYFTANENTLGLLVAALNIGRAADGDSFFLVRPRRLLPPFFYSQTEEA